MRADDGSVDAARVRAAVTSRVLAADAAGESGLRRSQRHPYADRFHRRQRPPVPDGGAALTQERAGYASDFNDVKAIGRVYSTMRTAEQTQMARLWHGVGMFQTTSPALWGNLGARRCGTGPRAGAVFALALRFARRRTLTQTMPCSTLSFTGKFLYGFWRPGDGHP